MDLFEYQGKLYFRRFGIPTSDGDIADTVDAAVAVSERIGYPVVVMAQGQVVMEGSPQEVRADPRVIDAYLGPLGEDAVADESGAAG